MNPSPTHLRSFRLPDLGEGLETAEITSWEIAEGDIVELNQTLCTVETAKAEVELPSPFAGTVVERRGEVGDEIAVGAVLVSVEVQGAPPDAGRAAGDQPGAATDRSGSDAPPMLVGYGASPDDRAGRRARVARSTSSAAGSRRRRPAVVRRSPIGAGTAIPLRGVRATTAERMTTSRREIPDASCGVWIDATKLLDRREALQAHLHTSPTGARLTPFSLIARCAILALRRWPMLNATLDTDNDQIWLLDDINLGFATATAHGLVVPVVHGADRLSLRNLADEIGRLTGAARDRSISPAEMLGGTFTISNFGGFGVDDGIPVINHPEAAILGVGAIGPRPWVVDGHVSVRSVAKLTCAFDHRICDGAEAARFLRTLADLIEAADLDLDG